MRGSGCYDNVAGSVGAALVGCEGVSRVTARVVGEIVPAKTARVLSEAASVLVKTALGESLRVRRKIRGLVGEVPAGIARVGGRRAGRREAALLVGTRLRGRLVVGGGGATLGVGETRI